MTGKLKQHIMRMINQKKGRGIYHKTDTLIVHKVHQPNIETCQQKQLSKLILKSQLTRKLNSFPKNYKILHHLLNLKLPRKSRGSPNNNASNLPEVYESLVRKWQQDPAFFIRFKNLNTRPKKKSRTISNKF